MGGPGESEPAAGGAPAPRPVRADTPTVTVRPPGDPGPATTGRPPPSRLAPGTRLGPYELVGELGRGGMGVVYRARRPDLGREFALKVVKAGSDADPEQIARFVREARAAAGLSGHPGIVGVHDIGEADGRAFFAMDLVEGGSLQQLVESGELPPRRAAEIVSQAARAVHHAHVHGILHRDLKPGNILVDREGRARVCDFGLAKSATTSGESAHLTKSGEAIGTPAYMSPEQAEAAPLDARSDVYSLGATLYEALCGQPPFAADTALNLLAKVIADDPVPPRRRDPRVPRALDVIVCTCLEKRPARRYATAAALADDLDRFLRDEAIVARPPGAVERLRRFAIRHRRATVVAALVILGAGAAASLSFVPRLRAESAARGRRDAARPHVDAGRSAVARLERALARAAGDASSETAIVVEARAAFERAVAADPSAPEPLVELGRVAMLLDDGRTAGEWLDRAVAVATDDGPARLERGIVRLSQYVGLRLQDGTLGVETPESRPYRERATEDLSVAALSLAGRPELGLVEGLRRLLADRPAEAGAALEAHARALVSDPQAWNWAGYAWNMARDAAGAERAFAEALALRPRWLLVLNGRGTARIFAKALVPALADFDAALRLRPADPDLLHKRGLVRYRLGDVTGALADFDASVRIRVIHPTVLSNRAVAKQTLGDLEGALADIEAANQGQPESALGRLNHGRILKARGSLPAALADFDRALELTPDAPEVLADRGDTRRQLGDLRGALADTDASLRVRPGHADTLSDRAMLRHALGDLDGGLADLDAVIAAEPEHCRARVNRGLLGRVRGEIRSYSGREADAVAAWTAAAADLEVALRLNPDLPEALTNRGVVRRLLGDLAGALADYDAALRLRPGLPEVLSNRGSVKEDLGDLDGAMADYDAAIRARPDMAEPYANRAILRAGRGDYAGAIPDMERALSLAPENHPARAASERILADLRARAAAQRGE